MLKFRDLFKRIKCPVIGMVHVEALPGTPFFKNSTENIIEKARNDTQIYLKHQLDAILVENMHDIPYIQPHHFTPETVATMTRVCTEIRRMCPPHFPLGIQILAGGNKEAIAVAQASNFNFIRAEGFVFSHVADEGFTDANAGALLRYRRLISADNILILADIKKKHCSHAITSDVTLTETAKAAEFFRADGLIITGTATGSPVKTGELPEVKQSTNLPILIGSGVDDVNLPNYIDADGLIIGSHFKNDGKWDGDLNEDRVENFMAIKKSLC